MLTKKRIDELYKQLEKQNVSHGEIRQLLDHAVEAEQIVAELKEKYDTLHDLRLDEVRRVDQIRTEIADLRARLTVAYDLLLIPGNNPNEDKVIAQAYQWLTKEDKT